MNDEKADILRKECTENGGLSFMMKLKVFKNGLENFLDSENFMDFEIQAIVQNVI